MGWKWSVALKRLFSRRQATHCSEVLDRTLVQPWTVQNPLCTDNFAVIASSSVQGESGLQLTEERSQRAGCAILQPTRVHFHRVLRVARHCGLLTSDQQDILQPDKNTPPRGARQPFQIGARV